MGAEEEECKKGKKGNVISISATTSTSKLTANMVH